MIDLDALLQQHDGILLAREHRARKSSLSRWCRGGRLARVLPGVYVAAGAAGDLRTRLQAVAARIPDAVIAGAAAAKLSAWPQEQVTEIEVLVPSRRVQKPGYRFIRRRVEPERIVERRGFSRLSAVQVAVDAADSDNGAHIDHLLRDHVECELLEAALVPGRVGNTRRRRVLRRSRTRPWSQAERRLHDLLDRHRVTGWRANIAVIAAGEQYWLDCDFPAERVALEVDGWEFHSSRRAFEEDRIRSNDLAGEGWTVLRVTWAMLADEARLVEWIQAARLANAARARRARARASP